MKKITYLLLIILSLSLIGLGLYLEFNKKEETKETEEFSYMPLLYKICDDDSCVYALGSIHLGDSRITKLDKKVLDAYNSTDYLVVEIDIKNNSLDLENYMLEDENTIEDFIDEDFKTKLIDFSSKHPLFNYEVYKKFKLGYISTVITSLIYLENGYLNPGVDDYFLTLAHESNKNIIELESIDLQSDILFNNSNEFYINQINAIIDNYELTKMYAKNLYDAYLSANSELLKLYLDIDTEASTEEEQQFTESLYTDRNFSMTDEVKKLLEENKNAFIVVGAAHVIGKDGIVNNLKDDYKIELIKN